MSQSNYYSFQSGDEPGNNKYQEDSYNNTYNQSQENTPPNQYNYNQHYNSQSQYNTRTGTPIPRPNTPRQQQQYNSQQLGNELFDPNQKYQYSGKYPGEDSLVPEDEQMSEAKMINQNDQPSSSRPNTQRKMRGPKWKLMSRYNKQEEAERKELGLHPNKDIQNFLDQQVLNTKFWNCLGFRGLVTVFSILGMLSIGYGLLIVIYLSVQNNQFDTIQYFDENAPFKQGVQTLQMNITATIFFPAYLYMVLPTFYQSHRRFQKNINFAQLYGYPYDFTSQYDLCLNDHTPRTFSYRYDFPCGLQSHFILNDTILDATLFLQNEDPQNKSAGHPLELNTTRLAWDVDVKFYQPPDQYEYDKYNGPVINVTNVSNSAFKDGFGNNKTLHDSQNAMVWFRLSSRPDSEKLMAVVAGMARPNDTQVGLVNLKDTIPPNSVINITVNSTFPYEKFLRLHNLGNKRNRHFVTNTLSGALYLAIGSLQIIWVVLILILQKLGLWMSDTYSIEAT